VTSRSVAVLTLWCKDCADRPTNLGYVVQGDRGYWLIYKKKDGYTLRNGSVDLTKAWEGRIGDPAKIECPKHGPKEVDYARIQEAVRTRGTATRPARMTL
jgi:hypothetical protein